jgi:hypothetical protein
MRVSVVLLAALALTSPAILSASATETGSLSSAAYPDLEEWVHNNYEGALECSLPLDPTEKSDLVHDVRWALAVRRRPAFEPEELLIVRMSWEGKIEALLKRAPIAIREQLRQFRQNQPVGSFEKAVAALSIETQKLDANMCPALVSISNQFERIQISPVPGDDIVLDTPTYELLVRTRTSEFRFSVSAGTSGDPLVRWTDMAFLKLRSDCANRMSR